MRNYINVTMTFFCDERQERQPQNPKLHWQRQSLDKSYLFNDSDPKSHRRLSPFLEFESLDGSGRNVKVKVKSSISTTKIDRSTLPQAGVYVNMIDCHSHNFNMSRHKTLVDDEGGNVRALELIRELSFSPPPTHTTATKTSSSFVPEQHDKSVCQSMLDLKRSKVEKRRPPSPLVGLKYLPDQAF